METGMTFKYYAFISYKREDEEWAKWLQHKLEHYHLPSNLNGRTDLPKEIRPIFKDTTELNPGNLPQQIHDALEQSKFLIVICSPRSAQSKWVNKEVETFMEMGKTDKIIPFIIDGKAFANNSDEECFPEAIRNLPAEQEILGANIGEMGRDAAAVKVVAQMFGLKFDELWQRHEREQRKKRNWIIAASITGFIIMAGIAFWMYAQQQQTLKANWMMMENQSRFVAEKALSIADDNAVLASLLAIDVLPVNLNHPNRPYTAEAERALRNSFVTGSTVLRGHTGAITAVAFSPDGKKVASASSDKTVRIWDAEKGICLYTLTGHTESVFCVAFSPDGEKVVSGSEDNTIRIWDIETGKEIRTIKGHDRAVIIVEWEGENIISRSHDGTVATWNANTGEEVEREKRDSTWLLSIGISHDEKRVAFQSNDTTITVLDADSIKEILSFPIDSCSIYKLVYSLDGKRIASASEEDKTIHIWNAKTGEAQFTLDGHAWDVLAISFSPDGKRIVSGSFDKTVRIWDLAPKKKTGKEFPTTICPNEKILTIMPNPDFTRFITTSEEGPVRMWDATTNKELQQFVGHDGKVNFASFSHDGKKIITASQDATVRIWDAETGHELLILNDNSMGVSYAAFSPDDKYVVSTSRNHSLDIWNAQTGEYLHTLTGPTSRIVSTSFSPDGKQVAAVSYDNTVRIWDTQTGDSVLFLQHDGKQSFYSSMAFSPDGKRLATTIINGINCIWDIQTGTKIIKFDEITSMDIAVCYSPDGKYIATASMDGLVHVWDATTCKSIDSFEFTPTEDFAYMTFDSSGQQIIISAEDGILRTYDFPPLQDLIDQTRERFKDRPLTDEERKLYYLE